MLKPASAGFDQSSRSGEQDYCYERETVLPRAKPNGLRTAPCMAAYCRVCAVRGMTFCAGLREEEIGELSAIATHVGAEARQIIFQEGDPAGHLFNVTGGVIKLYKLMVDGRLQVIGFLMPGDFLGLASMDAYAYSAEAITDVTLCRFPRSALDELFVRFPRLKGRLFDIANHEIAEAQDQMLLLGRKTSREKVATFLLRLSERGRRHGTPASPVAVPMSRADMADYLGLSKETVSRTLTQLKRRGLIRRTSRDAIELLDIPALGKLA